MMVWVCLGIIILAAIYDFRTMEVPLVLTVGGIVFRFLNILYLYICNDISIYQICVFLTCGLVLFMISYFGMVYGNFGGADTLINGLLGLTLGIYGIFTVMFSFVLVLPYVIYLKITNTEHNYPFVPYICIAYIATLVLIQNGF